jgi:hypothetical protein
MQMRKRIKNRMITSNKNAILAISVFDSRNSLLVDIPDEPKEDVNPEKNDGEDFDDEDDADEFEK